MDLNTISFALPLAFDGLVNGNMADQAQRYGSAQLSHSCRNFLTGTTLHDVHIKKFLGLHFNLGTRLRYKTPELSGAIRTNHYNLVSAPEANYDCQVPKGSYQSFSIHFTLAYLQPLEKDFPVLAAFLENAKLKKICVATARNLLCTAEIEQCIHAILHHQWRGPVRDAYLNAKIFDILICCLEAITQNEALRPASQAVVLKIQNAHSYLLLHLREHFSASFLADKVGLEKHVLRRGFKDLYKITMLDFLLGARMTKAKGFLRDTRMPINKIAFAIGYKKSSNFSDLFKKKFGFTPTEVRRGKDRDSFGGLI